MTYAEQTIRRNGIQVRVIDNCSPDSSDLNVCPKPRPGLGLIRLAGIVANERTVDLPKGHKFKISVTRYKNLTGHTKNLVTIQCERCDAKVETGPLRLDTSQMDYHIAATWRVFKDADFGRSCKEYRALKTVRAIMDQ